MTSKDPEAFDCFFMSLTQQHNGSNQDMVLEKFNKHGADAIEAEKRTKTNLKATTPEQKQRAAKDTVQIQPSSNSENADALPTHQRSQTFLEFDGNSFGKTILGPNVVQMTQEELHQKYKNDPRVLEFDSLFVENIKTTDREDSEDDKTHKNAAVVTAKNTSPAPANRKYFSDSKSRSKRHSENDQNKNSRYGSDFQRERSKASDESKSGSSSVGGGGSGYGPPSRSTVERSRFSPSAGQGVDTKSKESSKNEQDKSDVILSSKPKMSWADEMDDDENYQVDTRSQEAMYVSRKSTNPNLNQNQDFRQISIQTSASKQAIQTPLQPPPDYYSKQERQKRVYIHKHQQKVADMQSQKVKPEPPVVLKQSFEPTKLDQELPVKSTKPALTRGERKRRKKLAKQDQKESSPQSKKDGNKSGEKEGRRSIDKEIIHRNSAGGINSLNSSLNSAQQSASNVNCSSEQDDPNSGNKSSMISKSSSERSISGKAPQENVAGSVLKSSSISDASERDHVDRDSGSSQDNRSKRNYSHLSKQPMSQDNLFHNISGDGKGEDKYEQQQQRSAKRKKRGKTLSEREDGSDGDQHSGSRGYKSLRGKQKQINEDRGSYRVYHQRGDGKLNRPAARSGQSRRGRKETGNDNALTKNAVNAKNVVKRGKEKEEASSNYYSDSDRNEMEKKFVCPEKSCRKRFHKWRGLKGHMEYNHDHDRPKVICDVCSRQLKTQTALNVHMKSHSDKRPFSCSVCTAKFNLLQTLQRHKNIHAKIKDYKCVIKGCGAAFGRQGILNDHRRAIHSTVRAFPCTVENCGQKFKTKANLNSHMKTHSTTRQYQCVPCGFSANLKLDLVKHSNTKKCQKNNNKVAPPTKNSKVKN